jgi:ribosome-binding protein aMBF1 (putative translation factor)
MKNQTYAVGDTVNKLCKICGEELPHVVKTVTKQEKISRVYCSKCKTVGTFKASENSAKAQSLTGKTGAAYEQTLTYKTGQIMTHPNFGMGEVLEVFGTKSIDVLFADRTRRLVHSRQ